MYTIIEAPNRGAALMITGASSLVMVGCSTPVDRAAIAKRFDAPTLSVSDPQFDDFVAHAK